MTMLELQGQITEEGELIVRLPAGLPAGKVTVRIEVPAESPDWEHQPWTENEIRSLMETKPMPRQEFLAWLDSNPSPEPWGDLQDDEDAGDYIHRMRRQSTVWLEEPGEHA